MDVNRARAFLAVAEELHFGRAAHRLHMTQPPLSRLIRALEEELGARLFDRSPHRVSLTPVGEALVEPARELIMQSERMVELVRRVQHGEIGQVRLGFSGASVNAIISRLARALREQHPELSLELHGSQLSFAGMERLRRGELDAVLGRWDVLPGDVDSHLITNEKLLVALPRHHRLAAKEHISATDVAEEPWIVLPGGSGATLSARLHELARRGRFVPKVVATAPDSATQLLMVDAGNGVALTFSGVEENVPVHTVEFRPFEPDLGSVDVRLAWRRRHVTPALESFLNVVRALD